MGESSDEENSQLNRISSQFFVPASLPASPTDEAESTQDYLTAVVKKSLLDLKPQIEEEDSEPEVVYPPLMDVKSMLRERAAKPGGSAVLVADSEVEGNEMSAPSEGAITVEETVSEENADIEQGTASSDTDAANTTVILKGTGKDSKRENSPPSTQEDMFKDDDSDEEMHHTATPSRYLANLHLSAEPVLVPETIEESMDHICPSPDACGAMPVIVPSSPTQTPLGAFNPEDLATLKAECNPQQTHNQASNGSDSKKEQSELDQSQATEKSQAVSQCSQAAITAGPTMVGEEKSEEHDIWPQSQSLHLHLTTSESSQSASITRASRSPSAIQSQRKPGGCEGFGQSQDLHLFLTPSQGSPEQSVQFRLSVSKELSSALRTETEISVEKTSPDLNERQFPVEKSLKSTVLQPRLKPCLDPQSESQSISQTFFQMERADTTKMEGADVMKEEDNTMELKNFQSTCLRLSGKTESAGMKGDASEDFMIGTDKDLEQLGVNSLSSDSDVIPCSQDVKRRRPAGKEKELALKKKLEAAKVAPNTDVYDAETLVETVMEVNEESTQTYLVPSVAALGLQGTTTEEKLEGAKVTKVSHSEDKHSSQEVNKNRQTELSLKSDQHQSSIQEQEGSPCRSQQENQNIVKEPTTVGIEETNDKCLTYTEEIERPWHGIRTLDTQLGGLSGGADGEMDGKRGEELGRGTDREKDKDQDEGTAVIVRAAPRRRSQGSLPAQTSPAPQQLNPDPYSFVSQDGSRLEVSAGVAPKRGRKATGYRHKQLIKKKTQSNPRLEISSKSSSTDETIKIQAAAKSARRIKRLGKGGLPKAGLTSAETLAVSEAKSAGMTSSEAKSAPYGGKKGRKAVSKEQVSTQISVDVSSVTELAAGGSISVQTRAGSAGELPLLSSSGLLSSSKMLPSISAGPMGLASQLVPGQQSTSTVKSHGSFGLEVRSALSEFQGIASSAQDQGKIGRTRSVEFSDSVAAISPQKQPSLESQSSDSVIEETLVKEVVMQYKHRTITVRHVSLDGTILHEKVTEEKEDPVVMEENTLSKKRRITNPHSPSRSGGTLTSGDLADISSSSLSNRVGPSSLESNLSSLELPPQASSAASSAQETVQLQQRSSAERMLAPVTASSDQTNRAPRPVQTAVPRVSGPLSPDGLSPDQSTIERDESHVEAMVTSSSSGQASEPLYSADNLPQAEAKQEGTPNARPSLMRSSSSSADTPFVKGPTDSKGHEKQPKTVSHTRSRSAKRVAADSSQSEGKRDTRSSSSLVSKDVHPENESEGFIVLPSVSSKKSSGLLSDFTGTNATLQPASGKEKMVGGSVAAGSSTSSSNEQLSVQVPLQKAISDDDATPVVVQTASKLTRGAKIMARWKDGFFYPATFNGLNTSIGNKFRVKFEDGIEKTVRAVDIILAQHLPIGQSVLVASEDNAGEGTYDPGIIIEHIIEDNEVFYTVAMDDGSNRRCTRSYLLLTEDQASCLLSDEEMRVTFGDDMRHLNTADVSLDNILCGRRLRTKDAPALPPDPSNRPSTSIGLSRNRTDKAQKDICATPDQPKQEGEGNDAAEKESSMSTSTHKSSTRKRKVGPMATSTPTPKHRRLLSKEEAGKSSTLSVSPVGGVVVSPQTLPSSESCAGLFEKNQGPLPTKNIFLGMMFLLTHTDKYPETVAQEMSWLKQDLSADTSACDSNEDTAEVRTFPFDKHHLQRQIEAGSGVVLDRLNPSQVSSGKKKLFLISDTYQRTVKYLQCLAAGVPIVSHQWVIDSCKQDKLLDYKSYLLPAGISFEKRKIVERNTSANCLISHRILLTSSKPDFLEVWNSVLELSRCKILSNFPSTASKYRPCVDVVVTDETCIPSILKKAKQFGVPVVGSEWVIQCLINNQVMNHTAHERYSHDLYKNEERT